MRRGQPLQMIYFQESEGWESTFLPRPQPYTVVLINQVITEFNRLISVGETLEMNNTIK